MADEIVRSAVPEYAPAPGEVSGGSAAALLQQLENLNELLRQKNEEGRALARKAEELRGQESINRDAGNRALGEANVQGQVAEWKPAPGMTPVRGVEGVYRTGEATGIAPGEERPQAGPGRNLGSFSNVGVMPGRTYGDFRKEREWAHQLDLADAKLRGEDTPSDKGIRKMMDNVGKDRAALINANSDITVTPEVKAANAAKIEELNKKEVYLQSQLGRGKRTEGSRRQDYTPEIKPGWRSYLGQAKEMAKEPEKAPQSNIPTVTDQAFGTAMGFLQQVDTPERLNAVDEVMQRNIAKGKYKPEQVIKWNDSVKQKRKESGW